MLFTQPSPWETRRPASRAVRIFLLLEIFYKVMWLVIVAYPLWTRGTLAGSGAEGITTSFVWVLLPIVAVPWGYAFVHYVHQPARRAAIG